MNATELDHLVMQVDHLMQLIETLQFENAGLRQKMAVHIQERSRLQNQQDRIAKQIKQTIKQMKEELS
ncbi:MAG: TIGR02449 family protein [Gammaproteobacteria bacterium CG_4_10_14_0_8_um_filter_38_16]|nr:MAG: TIGR02449 family protein [Gammaproteobacteria bacterium CG_4_10_14_0_8_um_filter_38_16]PJA03908.1 MAG: TIGR02449 family protein [Gammaproteobacteria bacterium CG_4_10_14_0_2_um_filter_38_22]PJB09577.1 MAG: TIGR02449 family protein [Gammaproteobacteria bacterium CG_4_9_14_3_um_filter_38_9]